MNKLMPNLIHLIFVEYRRRLFWIPILVGLAIALFSPVDVLRYTVARTLVSVMAGIVPMIDHIDAQYELAQVLQLYFSVMWMLTPIIYFSLDIGSKTDQFAEIKAHHAPFWLRYVFMVVMFLLAIQILFLSKFDPFEGPGNSYFISHSRIGMATYGGVIVFGFAALAKLLVVWGSRFREIYFNGGEK